MDFHSGRIEFSQPPQLFPLTQVRLQEISVARVGLIITGICIFGTSGAGCY